MILALLLCLLAVSWIVILMAYLWESGQMQKPGRILYVGSNLTEQGPFLEEIIQTYLGTDSQKYNLVELGAGLARVSQFLAERFKWKEVIAVELGSVILYFGRLRFALLGKKNIVQYVQANIFDFPVEIPSVIYCYISTSMMDTLYQAGTLRGTLVISLSFPITGCPPTQVFPLSSWQKELYVYDFRPA